MNSRIAFHLYNLASHLCSWDAEAMRGVAIYVYVNYQVLPLISSGLI